MCSIYFDLRRIAAEKERKNLIMKKRALTLLLALAMIVSLAACGGGGNGPAGSYKMTKMNAAGVEMNIDDLAAMAGVDMTVTLELKDDGNFSLDMSALGTGSVSGTWTSSGSTVTLTSDGEDVNATISGKTLVMEQDGQSLTFEKQ